jgi:hypothetical protein
MMLRTPITGIARWARLASGRKTAAPPIRTRTSRRLIRSPSPGLQGAAPYQIDIRSQARVLENKPATERRRCGLSTMRASRILAPGDFVRPCK